MRRKKKSKPWIKQSFNKRADDWFELKHDIMDGDYYNFYSNDFFGTETTYVDFSFLCAENKGILWNAEMISSTSRYCDLIEFRADDIVTEAAQAEYGPDVELLGWQKREPVMMGNVRLNRVFRPIQPTFELFEGRTYQQQCQLVRRQLHESGEFVVHESITQRHDFQYGIGLRIVCDRYPTVESISHFCDIYEGEVVERGKICTNLNQDYIEKQLRLL